MELGNMLAQLRKEKGLNQRDFAKSLGVSNGAIAMWETNKRQPDLDMILKISNYYDVSVDYLLGIDSDKQHPTKNNNSSNISPEDELLLASMTTKARNLIDTFLQLDEDNQDIILGEAKKALKEQRLEEKTSTTPLKKVE